MTEKRHIRFWDLIGYAVVMNLGIRWLATAAAAGPASLPIWILAALGFLAPLTIAASELVGRSDGEGAIYAWSRDAFGPLAGFMCGWIYWMSNLPYFSGLLFFVIEVISTALPLDQRAAIQSPHARVLAACALAILLLILNLFGLGKAKWLPIAGAAASIGLYVIVLSVGAVIGAHGASATDFAHRTYLPPLDANGAILWSTMVFAYAGAEGLPLFRNEIEGGMPRLVRAMVFVCLLLVAAYLCGTVSMLSIMAPEQASRLSGLPEAISIGLGRVGLSGLAPAALMLLVAGSLGGYGAWFAAAARMPYAAGLDSALPPIFAKRDPRTGAPVAAMMLQTALVLVLVVISQLGASVRAAYDFIIAMTVLSYTIPYLFLFGAFIKAQATPAPAGAWAAPGGARVAKIIGWVGLLVTLSAIICSFVPSPDAADQAGAVIKLLIATAAMILSGAGLYALAAMRKPAPAQ
ncbi:MAG: APC family permease [Vitreimonas sp.]